MQLDFSTIDSDQAYFLLTQTVIPRPIAWVLSDNGNASLNLAPFSFFNAVCSDPPLILLSVGHKDEVTRKDTWVNIEERSHFVVHIAHRELLGAMNASSSVLPHGVSEVDQLGLKTVPFAGSPLPRLEVARVAMACEKYDIREIGPERQALILGRVNRLYVDDALVQRKGDRISILPDQLDPIARLGTNMYAFLGDYIPLQRPK